MEHLALLVERLLDAELLPDAEGARLLIEIERGRQALEEGESQTARRHIEQIARATETLVTTRALGLADGRAIIETARRILASDPD